MDFSPLLEIPGQLAIHRIDHGSHSSREAEFQELFDNILNASLAYTTNQKIADYDIVFRLQHLWLVPPRFSHVTRKI